MSAFTLPLISTAVLGAASLYLLLAGQQKVSRRLGAGLGTLSLVLLWFLSAPADWWYATHADSPARSALFVIAAGVSLVAAAMTVTSRRATAAAAWFMLLLSSSAALYAIHGAHFLAAATLLVGAGCLGLIFLLVARWVESQCHHPDQLLPHEPLLVSVTAALLLTGLIGTMLPPHAMTSAHDNDRLKEAAQRRLAQFERQHKQQPQRLAIRGDVSRASQAGDALFGGYPEAVAIAAVLMLIAVVSALPVWRGASGGGRGVEERDPKQPITDIPDGSIG